jgi:hypothetical protein
MARFVLFQWGEGNRNKAAVTREAKASPMESSMSLLKRAFAIPLFKYGLLALGLGLWVFGLANQLYSTDETIKYVLISMLMAAIAVV